MNKQLLLAFFYCLSIYAVGQNKFYEIKLDNIEPLEGMAIEESYKLFFNKKRYSDGRFLIYFQGENSEEFPISTEQLPLMNAQIIDSKTKIAYNLYSNGNNYVIKPISGSDNPYIRNFVSAKKIKTDEVATIAGYETTIHDITYSGRPLKYYSAAALPPIDIMSITHDLPGFVIAYENTFKGYKGLVKNTPIAITPIKICLDYINTIKSEYSYFSTFEDNSNSPIIGEKTNKITDLLRKIEYRRYLFLKDVFNIYRDHFKEDLSSLALIKNDETIDIYYQIPLIDTIYKYSKKGFTPLDSESYTKPNNQIDSTAIYYDSGLLKQGKAEFGEITFKYDLKVGAIYDSLIIEKNIESASRPIYEIVVINKQGLPVKLMNAKLGVFELKHALYKNMEENFDQENKLKLENCLKQFYFNKFNDWRLSLDQSQTKKENNLPFMFSDLMDTYDRSIGNLKYFGDIQINKITLLQENDSLANYKVVFDEQLYAYSTSRKASSLDKVNALVIATSKAEPAHLNHLSFQNKINFVIIKHNKNTDRWSIN